MTEGTINVDLSDVRKAYKDKQDCFLEENLKTNNPFILFNEWFIEAKNSGKFLEPNAVCLSTADKDGNPSARMVLLKHFNENDGFKIYTNLDSRKGICIKQNPKAALLFYWDIFNRQIRIEGSVSFVSEKESNVYFQKRPRISQLAAVCSNQSKFISSRNDLLAKFKNVEKMFENQQIKKPENWGGIKINPNSFEFWQGQTSRLHDRILFIKNENNQWVISRLQP